MTTWGSFKMELGRKVYDLDADKYPEAALAGINDALRFIAATHTGLPSIFEFEAVGESTFPLPEVIARVIRVTDAYNNELEEQVNLGVNGYLIWGPSIIVYPTPRTDLKVYAECYYNEITGDADVLNVPQWMLEPLKLYAASRILDDPGCQFALLNQFKTRVDSGNPEQMPLNIMAAHYMKQFHELLNRHPRRYL